MVKAAAEVEGYQGRGIPAPASAFARSVVAALGPLGRGRARPLLWSTSRLAAWGISVGLEPVPAVLLHPSVIVRFVEVGLGTMTPASRRSVRTNLRFVARRVAAAGAPEPPALSREVAKAPYSPAELSAYLALADAQPTEGRRHRLGALVGLGAGAGLEGRDLRVVTGRHLLRRSGGLVVVVEGSRPRVVPVLSRYRPRLEAAAAFAGERFMCGGRLVDRRNVTAPLLASIAGGADLPRLEVGRLRASWLCEQASRLGLPTFLAAAGVAESQRIFELARTLPAGDEAERVALLG